MAILRLCALRPNWRVAFSTPNSREDVTEAFEGATLQEALEAAIKGAEQLANKPEPIPFGNRKEAAEIIGRILTGAGWPTALVDETMPGLLDHFVKQGTIRIAA